MTQEKDTLTGNQPENNMANEDTTSVENENIMPMDENGQPLVDEEELKATAPIIKDFVKDYAANQDKPIEEWLNTKMQAELPEKSPEEIKELTTDIIEGLRTTEAKKAALSEAVKNGRSKESWFADEMKKATSAMSSQEAAQYLSSLEQAVEDANNSMYRTITTKAGIVNQNPSLDGFIAEQQHVNSFNMNAAAKGSDLHAEVLTPKPGSTYSKNSVDVVIKDGSGKIVHRYQMKYGQDAESTIRMIKAGNYNNQQLIVPADQVEEVQKAFPNKTVSSFIEADGITGKPLTKPTAKQLQAEAQSGNWQQANFNEYAMKDLAVGIGKNVAKAGAMGAAIGAGLTVAQKVWEGEEIEGDEVVEAAITTGADLGVKTAAASALTVASEKGIINCLPKGPGAAGAIANIAFVGVENVKILGKMATGELSGKEGIEQMEQTTVSAVAGIAASTGLLTLIPGVGPVVGLVCGTLAYMAGSTIGQAVVKKAQEIRDKVVNKVKKIGARIDEIVTNVSDKVSNVFDSILSWF